MTLHVLVLRFTATLLGLVCLGHLYRVVLRLDLIIADWPVPLWVSVVAVAVTGWLCACLWRMSNRAANGRGTGSR